MDFVVVNLKNCMPSVDVAIANLEVEIETAKRYGVKAIKIIHGYGSHGVGGAIRFAVKNFLENLKRKRVIKDIIAGVQFSIENEKTCQLLFVCPQASQDEDLGRGNIGITVAVI